MIASSRRTQLRAKRGQIRLGDHQNIGERGLPRRLGKTVEALRAIDGVDQRDDARQMQGMIEHRVGAEREQDRRRVGKASGFDDDPPKPPDLACLAPVKQGAQGARKILTDGAAQATARQFEHAPLDEIDEVVVDRDLADLVDDDGGVGE